MKSKRLNKKLKEINNISKEDLNKLKIFYENRKEQFNSSFVTLILKGFIWFLAVVAIPLTTFIYSTYQQKKEISRNDTQLKMKILDFYFKNYDNFYSNDIEKRKRTFKVLKTMEMTLPNKYLDSLLTALYENSDTTGKRLIDSLKLIPRKTYNDNYTKSNKRNKVKVNFYFKSLKHGEYLKIKVDNKPINIDYSNEYFCQIKISSGKHKVTILTKNLDTIFNSTISVAKDTNIYIPN